MSKNVKRSLVAIRGGMRCGKDEVGSMIQYLTSDHGKNGTRTYEQSKTKVDMNGYAFGDFTRYGSDWEIKKFADKLKDILCILLGCTRHDLESEDFKNTIVSEEWWYYQYGDGETMVPYLESKHDKEDDALLARYLVRPTPRMILQFLGTELMRNQLHPNVWVNATFADYDDDNWVVTDVRFNNEVRSIKGRGGLLINVIRPFEQRYPEHKEFADGFDYDKVDLKEADPKMYAKLNHTTETELNDYDGFDYTLVNDGTLEDLLEKVKEVLIKENIL